LALLSFAIVIGNFLPRIRFCLFLEQLQLKKKHRTGEKCQLQHQYCEKKKRTTVERRGTFQHLPRKREKAQTVTAFTLKP